jgi:hypothetical protein
VEGGRITERVYMEALNDVDGFALGEEAGGFDMVIILIGLGGRMRVDPLFDWFCSFV